MEIIDIRKNNDKKFIPIGMIKDQVICKQLLDIPQFPEILTDACGFWKYDIKNDTFKRIDKDNKKIYYYDIFDEEANDEDSIYFLSKEKQINYDTYTLYRLDIETEKQEELYTMDVDKNYYVRIVTLNKNYFLSFLKEIKTDVKFTSVEESAINNDEAYLYDIKGNKKYKVMDKTLVQGYKYNLFQTKLKNKSYMVFEEVYLDLWEKEDKFKYSRKEACKSRVFTDCLRIMPLDKFINELKEGKSQLSFMDLANKGYDGVVAFLGINKEELYYSVREFKSGLEKLIAINRSTLTENEIIIPIVHDNKALYENVFYCVDGDKRVIQQRIYEETVYNKELIGDSKEFTYKSNLGRAIDFIENRYLITQYVSMVTNNRCTAILDMKTDQGKKYTAEAIAFKNKLILF